MMEGGKSICWDSKYELEVEESRDALIRGAERLGGSSRKRTGNWQRMRILTKINMSWRSLKLDKVEGTGAGGVYFSATICRILFYFVA